jgi:hypothetical protein
MATTAPITRALSKKFSRYTETRTPYRLVSAGFEVSKGGNLIFINWGDPSFDARQKALAEMATYLTDLGYEVGIAPQFYMGKPNKFIDYLVVTVGA